MGVNYCAFSRSTKDSSSLKTMLGHKLRPHTSVECNLGTFWSRNNLLCYCATLPNNFCLLHLLHFIQQLRSCSKMWLDLKHWLQFNNFENLLKKVLGCLSVSCDWIYLFLSGYISFPHPTPPSRHPTHTNTHTHILLPKKNKFLL